MQTVWIGEDGAPSSPDDPTARRYAPADVFDTVLAQNAELRELLALSAQDHPNPAARERLLAKVAGHADLGEEIQRLRMEVVRQLRFPSQLRKVWSAQEVAEWLDNEAIRLASETSEAVERSSTL